MQETYSLHIIHWGDTGWLILGQSHSFYKLQISWEKYDDKSHCVATQFYLKI